MSIIWNIAELDMDDYEHLKPYQRLCQIPWPYTHVEQRFHLEKVLQL